MAQHPRTAIEEPGMRETGIEVSDLPPLFDRAVEEIRASRDYSFAIVGVFGLTIVLSFTAIIRDPEAWPAVKELLFAVLPIEGILLYATKDRWLPKRR